MAQLVDADCPGHPERAIVFTVQAWDANCPLATALPGPFPIMYGYRKEGARRAIAL